MAGRPVKCVVIEQKEGILSKAKIIVLATVIFSEVILPVVVAVNLVVDEGTGEESASEIERSKEDNKLARGTHMTKRQRTLKDQIHSCGQH